MAESSLSIAYADLAAAVGYYLGFGSDYTAWDTAKTNLVDNIIQRGYRQFITPQPVPGDREGHIWSFLNPRTTIEVFGDATGTVVGLPVYAAPVSTITVAAASFYSLHVGKNFVFDTSGNSYPIASYVSSTVITVTGDASGEAAGDTFTIECNGNFDLPDDFGGVIKGFYYDEDNSRPQIMERSQGFILNWRQGVTSEDYPAYWAVGLKAKSITTGTRWELMLYPTPNSNYILAYQYHVLLPRLTRTTHPYPVGGMIHGDTIMASVMAVAELDHDETAGARDQDYVKRLTASVHADRNLMAPTLLGKMDDDSDDEASTKKLIRNYITYQGTLYSP